MWDIKSKFGQNTCPTMKIFTQTVRNVNKLLYFFPFIKKTCQVLQLSYFKVQCLNILMKVGNPSTILLNCCQKLIL